MTPDAEQAANQLRHYIERAGLGAVLNETQWRAAVQALQGIAGFAVRFRVKDVRGPEPAPDQWDSSFPWHLPQPYASIEWLDIDPVVRRPRGRLLPAASVDYREQIMCALRAVDVPFVEQGPAIRIQGYRRPATEPERCDS
jgi:hypothetical protein